MHIWDPKRKAQAIRNAESVSFRPKDDIGSAYRKSEAFSDDTANNRAFSFFVGAEAIKFLNLLQ